MPPADCALVNLMSAGIPAFDYRSRLQGASVPCNLNSLTGMEMSLVFSLPRFPLAVPQEAMTRSSLCLGAAWQCFPWQYLNLSVLFHP